MQRMELATFHSLYATYPHPLLSFDMRDAEALDSKDALKIERTILRKVCSYKDIDNSLIVRLTLFTNLIYCPASSRVEIFFPFTSTRAYGHKPKAIASVMSPKQRALTAAKIVGLELASQQRSILVRDEVPTYIYAASPHEYGVIRKGDPKGDMVRIDGENIPVDQETYSELKRTCLRVIQKKRELNLLAEVILDNRVAAWKRRRHAIFLKMSSDFDSSF